MLRISVILLSTVMACTAALSQEPPTQSPPPDQQTEWPAESQKPPENQQTGPTLIPPAVSTPEAKDSRRDTPAEHSKSGSEQANWLEKFLYDVKVTDVLLVLFTGALAIYTGRLWYATAGLWEAAREQSGDMKASIKVAEDAANAAKKSADVAEAALVKLQRAVVYLEKIEVGLWGSPEQKHGVEFKLKFKNGGLSVARHMFCTGHGNVFRGQMPANFIFTSDTEITSGPSYLIPNEAFWSSPLIVESGNIQAVIDGKARLFFWGHITYRDIFDGTPEHITKYCWEAIPVIDHLPERLDFDFRTVEGPNTCMDERLRLTAQPRQPFEGSGSVGLSGTTRRRIFPFCQVRDNRPNLNPVMS
jgi:hypothetical protein